MRHTCPGISSGKAAEAGESAEREETDEAAEAEEAEAEAGRPVLNGPLYPGALHRTRIRVGTPCGVEDRTSPMNRRLSGSMRGSSATRRTTRVTLSSLEGSSTSANRSSARKLPYSTPTANALTQQRMGLGAMAERDGGGFVCPMPDPVTLPALRRR